MAFGIRQYFGWHFSVDEWADGNVIHAQPIGGFVHMRMTSPAPAQDKDERYIFTDSEIKAVVDHCANGLYDSFYVKKLKVASITGIAMLTHSLKGDVALYIHWITPTEYSSSTGIYVYGSHGDDRIRHETVAGRTEERLKVSLGSLGQRAWDEFDAELTTIKSEIWIEKLHTLMGNKFNG